MGSVLAGARDVNADGIDDVLIGVPGFEEITIDPTPGNPPISYYGAVYVFHGATTTGPASTPDTVIKGDTQGVDFGETASSAGDYNGDGYGDILIATTTDTFLHLGSSNGVAAVAAAQLNGLFYGGSVSPADDVNGDGSADFVLQDTGGLEIYNSFSSLAANRIIQRDGGDVDEVITRGRSDDSFTAIVEASPTAAQGDEMKLLIEACLLPANFGDANCVSVEHADWQTVLPGGTELALPINAIELPFYPLSADAFAADGMYRWRARLEFRINDTAPVPWSPQRTRWIYYQGDPTRSVVDVVVDADGDGTRDTLDTDDDEDGVDDTLDVFPQNVDEWADLDGDGQGDNLADTDDDGDGTSDVDEIANGTDPSTPSLVVPNLSATETAAPGNDSFSLDAAASWIDPNTTNPLRQTDYYEATLIYGLEYDVGGGNWVTLTFDANGYVDNVPALNWLNFDTASGVISGQPSAVDEGTYDLRLFVTDDQGSPNYDIDVDGTGTNLQPYLAFTLDVPEDRPPNLPVLNMNPAISATNYVSLLSTPPGPKVVGTSDDIHAPDPEDLNPGVAQVEVQIAATLTDGMTTTNWGYTGAGFVVDATPVWVLADCTAAAPTPCDTWELDTENISYPNNANYTVRARAIDKADNVTQREVEFDYFEGAPAFTTLELNLNRSSILLEETVDVTVNLEVPGEPGANLSNLPITLTVTDPQDVDTVIPLQANATGQAQPAVPLGATGSPVQFDQSGDWQVSANFAGAPEWPQYQGSTASPELLLVGKSAGYAVLVQGRNDVSEGIAAHNKTANVVYRTLLERNLEDPNIIYFNHDPAQDANRDGFADNNVIFNNGIGVDAVPDKATIQATIEGLGPLVAQNPAPIWLVFHDHGNTVLGESRFELDGSGATITPAELAGWIDTLINDPTNGLVALGVDLNEAPVIFVNGSCYSGGFIAALSPLGVISVTSAAADEVAYKGPLAFDEDSGTLVRAGSIFLEALFKPLGGGADLAAAFISATAKTEQYTRIDDTLDPNTVVPYVDTAAQHPLADANGDGIGSNQLSTGTGTDGEVLATIKLGTGLDSDVNSAAAPATVIEVTPTLYLPDGVTNAELTALANNANADVSVAFIEVRRPATVLESGIVDDGTGNPVTEQREAGDYVRRQLGIPANTDSDNDGDPDVTDPDDDNDGDPDVTDPDDDGDGIPDTEDPNIGGCAADRFCLDFGAGAGAGDIDQFDVPGTYEVYYYVQDAETGELSAPVSSTVIKALSGGSNSPPPAPTLVSPADGATGEALAVILDWTSVADPDGDAVTYTVRIATDAAMTAVIYEQDQIAQSIHAVPPGSGLANDTDYWWDVQALDEYGASVDPVGGAWVPSAPFMFRTAPSGNNNIGVIQGVIRGLTQSNAIVTQLNNASIAQTNGTPEQVIVHYDDVLDVTAYIVRTPAGVIQLQGDADDFDAQTKAGLSLGVGETIQNEDFFAGRDGAGYGRRRH